MADVQQGMTSESLSEARERFVRLSERESAGMAAAQEGNLVPDPDPDGELAARADAVDEHGAALMALTDARGEVMNADADANEETAARKGRRSSRRGGRKSSK